MNKEEIERIAENYGFTLWAIINNGKTFQFLNDAGINLIVYDNADYELKWIIPHTLFEIICPKCGSFGSKHFEKMLTKFKIEVQFRTFQEIED